METALWKKDIGSILRFPGILAQREPKGGAPGKRPRTGPVESGGGVSGGKAQAPISPGKGFDCFISETSYILTSSGMQVPSLFDFQQIGQ